MTRPQFGPPTFIETHFKGNNAEIELVEHPTTESD